MAGKPLTVHVAKTVADPLSDDPHAPFIFFDGVPSHGQMPGVIAVNLSASRMLPDEAGNIHMMPVPVVYLRTNIGGAQQLLSALQQALAMAAAAQDGLHGTTAN